jgi:uncharacterized coiled-coil DUF342 family protein
MELELVNDLMKTRVSQVESTADSLRAEADSLRAEVQQYQSRERQYQSRENELYRKIDHLKDELVDTFKERHSRSPSSSSRGSGDRDHEESSAKRRKVLVSELLDESQSSTQNDILPAETETQPIEINDSMA